MKTASFSAFVAALLVSASLPAHAEQAAAKPKMVNVYEDARLIANSDKYKAATKDEKLINAWGIAIRPAGAGGHFWVTGKDNSFEYVGDVQSSPDEKLHKLHTDSLTHVKLPVGGADNFATGTVYSDSKDGFVITQTVEGAEPITAPAKFLFASDGGIISAWTERKKADGTFDRSHDALKVIDESASGSQFFGLTLSHDYSRLYAADFGKHPGIKVYDKTFKPVDMKFDNPFDDNKNGVVDAGEYAPFNVQALATPGGQQHIFVTYAMTQTCPEEEVAKKTCAEGEIFAGEEDTSRPGYGRLAEFTEEGKLYAVWDDESRLSAPWGLAFTPNDFGALSNTLLVSNFGDGKIVAFSPEKHNYVDVMRNESGKAIVIEKIWGIIFGNGESLGDKNALYYAAGPDDEKDGVFGSLRVQRTNYW